MLSYFFLSCKVSAENLLLVLRGFLCNKLLSLAAFKIISKSLTFDNLVIICLGVGLVGFFFFGIFLVWYSLGFPGVDISFFSHIREFFSYYLIK